MLQQPFLHFSIGNEVSHRLYLHVSGIPKMIDSQLIMYLQSEVNYTRFYLKDGKSYLEAKTLKHFNGILNSPDFIRIHKSYLVNCSQICTMTPDFVLLQNGEELPISRRKRRTLKKNNSLLRFWKMNQKC